MSRLVLSADRMDAMSDWMNPILVKETRQALKSRQFVATFMLLLVACWLICLFGVALQGPSIEYGSPSTDFFQGFSVVLSIAIILIIPFSSFRSLLTEQDSQTYELLSITSLTARQIVLGKLFNSILQIFVFYAAIAPFVAFTSLLQGFDLFRTLIVLSMLFGISVLLCMFTLMLSTVARSKQIQTLSSLFIFGGLITALSMTWGISSTIVSGFMELDSDFYWVMTIMWLIGISYFFLFLQITVSQLMFDSANRSTGVRIVASAQFALVWLGPVVYTAMTGLGVDAELLQFMVFVSIIHWSIFGFFIAMERDYLSRRVRRDISQNFILRLIKAPFMPGGTRGFLLVLINFGIIFAISLFVQTLLTSSSSRSFFEVMTGLILYAIIYLGIGCLLTRRLLLISNEMHPMHGRTLLVVIFAIGAIVPYSIMWAMDFYNYFNPEYSIIQITNPFETLSEIQSSGGDGFAILVVLAIGALLIVCLNLFAIFRSLGEVIFPKRLTAKTGERV